MDNPVSQQEETKEQTVTPSEVWDRLSPEVRERVMSLLGRMAYKYLLSSQRQSSKDEDGGSGGEQ